jgi:hypothetical protein
LLPEGVQIPRIIHQAYVPKAGLTPELRANMAWIRAAHPGWEHRFYGGEEVEAFVSDAYGPRIWRYFERISDTYNVVKVDLFKYLLMYKVGGVYLDSKSRPTRPLDEVLRPDDRFLLSKWRNGRGEPFEGFGLHPELKSLPGGEFQQWHIVASPGHPYLRAVIRRVLRNLDRYNPALNGAGQHGVLRLTGPIPYALAVQPLVERHPHRWADSLDDLGFQYSIFGDGFAHRTRLGVHYSDRDDPILKVGVLTHASAPLIHGARAVKKQIRDALRPRRAPEPVA